MTKMYRIWYNKIRARGQKATDEEENTMTNMISSPREIREKIEKFQNSQARVLRSVDINRRPMRNGDVRLELIIGFTSLNGDLSDTQYNTFTIGNYTDCAEADFKRYRLVKQVVSPIEIGWTSN